MLQLHVARCILHVFYLVEQAVTQPASSTYQVGMAPIPFSEPPYLTGLPTPYYSSSHLSWQKACRTFIDENLHQHAMNWEREVSVPSDVFSTFAAANMLVPSLPAPLPIQWLKKLGVHEILGLVKVEDWDYMHTAIYIDEV